MYVFIHIKTYQEAILINMDIFIININFFKYQLFRYFHF